MTTIKAMLDYDGQVLIEIHGKTVYLPHATDTELVSVAPISLKDIRRVRKEYKISVGPVVTVKLPKKGR